MTDPYDPTGQGRVPVPGEGAADDRPAEGDRTAADDGPVADDLPAGAGRPPERDPGFDDALGELPPNVPPGILGEQGFDLYKADDDGPHGLNAGLLQETSFEVTLLAAILAYLLFFPLAYVIVWRSRTFTRTHKWVLTGLMTAGLAVVAYGFATGYLYFA